jgi:hypothetical protein
MLVPSSEVTSPKAIRFYCIPHLQNERKRGYGVNSEKMPRKWALTAYLLKRDHAAKE